MTAPNLLSKGQLGKHSASPNLNAFDLFISQRRGDRQADAVRAFLGKEVGAKEGVEQRAQKLNVQIPVVENLRLHAGGRAADTANEFNDGFELALSWLPR